MKNYRGAIRIGPGDTTGGIHIFRPGGSKSISNRVLLIDQLAGGGAQITGLSESDDTRIMKRLLTQETSILDAGHAGTCYRFMVAYLSLLPGEQILTGSERMLERPVGPLVDALNSLGAQIEYLGRESYPPLKIGESHWTPERHSVTLPGDISSQFISALMMVAPRLPGGLTITITPPVSSRDYLGMTARIMRHFGADVREIGDGFEIAPGNYKKRPFQVEADWSSAAFALGWLAIARDGEIHIPNLYESSVQGDRVIKELASHWGVRVEHSSQGITAKVEAFVEPVVDWDFRNCPDLAPVAMSVHGALGINGEYIGLESLRIKESDRIEAMRSNLLKGGVVLDSRPDPSGRIIYTQKGKLTSGQIWRINSYNDHRIAMSMALWGLKGTVIIEDPEVVGKSYPSFWSDLEKAGMSITPEG